MRASFIGGVLAAALMSTTAFSQSATSGSSSAPAATPPAATSGSATSGSSTAASMSGQWRTSKLMGLDIYNEQNEKLGDINEILMDQQGKVTGYVIGVGGFLGMGTREIMVEPAKIKFVNEPVKTSSASNDNPATANASAERPRAGSAATGTTGTSGSTGMAANNTSNSRANEPKWAPDHGVLSGASKDQLKAMPEFKYDTTASR